MVMQKLTCEWRGKLISVDRENKSLDLYTLRRGEASGSAGWALNTEPLGSVKLLESGGDDIQACGVALDAKRGIKSIFLVSLRRPSLESATALYSILTYSPSTRKVARYGESLVNSQPFTGSTPPEVGSVTILDGPVVVWSEGKQLLTMYAVNHTHKKLQRQTYNIEKLVSSGYHLVKVTSVWPFSWAEERDPIHGEWSPILIVFVKLSVAKDDDTFSDGDSIITEWVCLKVKHRRESLSVKLLKEAEFIPRDYGRISTCVTLHKSYGVDLSSGDITSKYQFLVGTEYCQVVLLHCGVVLQSVALKYVPIQIALLNSEYGQLTFACRGHNNEATAYHLGDEDGAQECGEWQGVCDMVVGDFAQLGHEQLLLLFADSITDFLVTDLEQFSTASKREGEEEERSGQQCAESLVSVVNALHLRKHNGEAYLTTVKTELQLKTELLERSLSLLKSLEQQQQQQQQKREQEGEGGEQSVCSLPAHHSDPGLVCIIPGEVGVSERSLPADNPAQPRSQPPLKTVRLWQRLKGSQWVIGAVVKNHSLDELKDVRFSISPLKSCQQNAATDCSSRVVWIERPDTSSLSSSQETDSPPPAKRRKIEEPFHGLLEELMEDGKKEEDNGLTLGAGMKLCVVLLTTVPPSLGSSRGNCEESVAIIATWKKAGGASTLCSPHEEVSGIRVATLSYGHLCSGELNLHHSCLSLWNGQAMLTEEINLEQKSYQDLVCVLGISSFVLVEASSMHTNLLGVAAMLRSRLPLQSGAVITSSTQTDSSRSRSKFADDAIQSDHSNSCHSLEVLEGVLLHVSPHVNSARVAVLFRSFDQLSLLLSLMKHCLPVDVSLELLTGTSWSVSLRASLTSVLEEAKGRCTHVERRMRGRGDGRSEEEEGELLDKLREKTDLRMSVMATQ